ECRLPGCSCAEYREEAKKVRRGPAGSRGCGLSAGGGAWIMAPMARARRQPPLFEVLHEPSRRASGGSALSPGTGLRPVQVTPSGRRREPEAAPPAPPAPAPLPAAEPPQEPVAAAWWAGEWGLGGQKGILLGIAAVMALLAVTWAVAFWQGRAHEASKLNLPEAGPVVPAVDPMLTGAEPSPPPSSSSRQEIGSASC